MKSAIFKTLKKALSSLGIQISLSQSKKNLANRKGKKNLNVGCGKYIIDGFISLDIYTEHYHRNRKRDFIEYDLRKDRLPFPDNSVDNIYISHVIEHVETDYVVIFMRESHRVLKTGGVLRIACPDAEFLWRVSRFDNEYWTWRKGLIEKGINKLRDKMLNSPKSLPSQMDFFIREVSTPRSAYEGNSIETIIINGNDIKDLSYDQALNLLTEGLSFRVNHPGQHINAWDFSRLKNLGEEAGFKFIIKSKPNGSISSAMQGTDMDRTHPEMSLYVDMLK
ncbi:methyltransferase domain-containing protein [Synechocystis sp. LKSZ1]|uniref:class I SAM-dependent methyltransferase n=1 Tax=Synechocystis sp. LKSZ1 TaxID=3144951 RepID=UPI00336C2006